VAIDPLDGSSSIETIAPIGTIFSILPRPDGDASPFMQPGSAQLAAGFLLYGSSTTLALTLGEGTQIFTLDRRQGEFVVTYPNAVVPQGCREYAINDSNYRFWDEPVRAYVDDCLAGGDGPMGLDHNTRWLASLVAEAFRILRRGGVYLYPGDARASTRNGRLRLVYEANPIAFLMEQAGGAATNGVERILDLQPATLHGRVPLVFGSRDQVGHVSRYHTERSTIADRSPLFNRRSLLRA
jgi:fructose-1,6-bisphosphatase I